MNKYSLIGFLVTALTASSLFIGGCGATTGKTRLFVLHSLSGEDVETEIKTADEVVAIGIGPIEFPDYLDRPQIITRISKNELRLAEFDQWAVPLKEEFSRVLGENLSVLLSTDRVYTFPWKRSTRIDYRVTVRVTRFDTGVGGESLLVANWSILKGDDKTELLSKKSGLRGQAKGRGYGAIVSAMNSNLTNLGREIAAAIKENMQ